MNSINLRPNQQKILEYNGGKLAVSAVPGSGKTFTLALLAAEILARNDLQEDQEILTVTLVNSAVDNFYQRVSSFLKSKNLIPNIGYRVRTLHGLSHDIVRERPDLAGLDTNFQILDDNDSLSIIRDIAQIWLHNHPDFINDFIDPELENDKLQWIVSDKMPEVIQDIAVTVIRHAKDQRASASFLRAQLNDLQINLPLAKMGIELYEEYEAALAYRGAVDFDDLVRLALVVLESDAYLLERLRHRWPFILEDEAQDSSRLQQDILTLLVEPAGNWVRVGDPNQAIYETFTTASPKHLQAFMEQDGVTKEELPHSGRSTLSIIDLANFLVVWTKNHHPVVEVRDALFAPPYIEPVPPSDEETQNNPEDNPRQVVIFDQKLDSKKEIQLVADSLLRWLPDHADLTVAVLSANNHHANEFVDALKERNIPYNDSLLRSSSDTRLSANILGTILRYLADPQSPGKLAKAYEAWEESTRVEGEEDPQTLKSISELIRKREQLEDYLWPSPETESVEEELSLQEQPEVLEKLLTFRDLVRRWQNSILLPIDQLILTLAQDLYQDTRELALAHKIASLLKQSSRLNPSWRLPEMAQELAVIASNERRFIGFSEDDLGFEPDHYRGKVVVSTIHKAKGLEWDRVHILSLNNYDFPSGLAHDSYLPEKWFIRNKLNLPAEALSQVTFLTSKGMEDLKTEGLATLAARLDYVRERLRLLYVGITRAKRELILTWNTGRFGDVQPAAPFIALHEYWYSKDQTT